MKSEIAKTVISFRSHDLTLPSSDYTDLEIKK